MFLDRTSNAFGADTFKLKSTMKLLVNTSQYRGWYSNFLSEQHLHHLQLRLVCKNLHPYWFIMVFSALHNHNNNITATRTLLDLDPIAWRLNSAMWMDIDWDRWIELGQKKHGALKWDTHVDWCWFGHLSLNIFWKHAPSGWPGLTVLVFMSEFCATNIYLVGGLEHGFYFPFHICFFFLPIDELIFFKVVKTTNQLFLIFFYFSIYWE